jgi:NADPH-dependent F420 reductase
LYRTGEEMIKTIGIVGGTGKEGKGLAYRWSKSGYEIFIGSRQIEKAELAASEINALLAKGMIRVRGLDNNSAARIADIVVLTVPFAAHQTILSELRTVLTGKILIDVSVPLVPPKVAKVQMPPAGSAALEAKAILDETTEIVTAFQNISYERLITDEDIDCDVLVCGSSKEAREIVIELVEKAGMVGWDAGPIENSVVVEGMTSILIGINKQHGSHTAGIRITGVERTKE